MSLQGTIDTFAIPDVLRLLASTKKTGQLVISGSRGTGHVWVANGDIAHSEASAAPWATNNAEVVFELLRYTSGDFVFEIDTEFPDGDKRIEKVDPILNAANGMMREWEEIEKVVPSLASPLHLAGGLPEPMVEINEASWKMIVGIGSGTTVGELGDLLEQGEIVVSRNVKQLVEAKLVDIEYAEPVLPGGSPVYLPPPAGPQVSFASRETPATESRSPAFVRVEFPAESTPDEVGEAPEVEQSEVEQSEVEQSEVYETPVEPMGDIRDDPDYQRLMAEEEARNADPEPIVDPIIEPIAMGAVADGPSPFDAMESPVEDLMVDEIDLDDPVQIARAIEQMDTSVTRMVTKAARAETADEREEVLAEISQSVSTIHFAVIQRFVYSLAE